MTSDGGSGGKRRQTGRERSAEVRRQQAAAERRRKQMVIGGVVAAVVVLAVLIGVLVQHNTSKSNQAARNAYGAGQPFTAPTGVSANPATQADPGGIVYGKPDAKVAVEVDEDVRCPYCKIAEGLFGGINKEYADAGKIKVQYHLVDLIDRVGGGQGSLVGGATLACAADVGQAQFIAFHDLLFKNQPDEKNDTYGNVDNVLNLASQVPGLRSAAFDDCARSGKYAPWIKANYDYLSKKLGGSVGTPDIYIDGTQFYLKDPATVPAAQQQADYRAALDAAIAKQG
ncbi:DsbA family protein [Catenulispora subtropica]|uniref:Thioredoxin-like fold domain-containing protein n=1 Tax=Catenulispora subtropica TaxID=450798 RepID=A0ABN2TBW9_9ACTN